MNCILLIYHYYCTIVLINYHDKQFKSSDHLYGYRICLFAGEAALAEQVDLFNAPDPFAAKRLTQTLDAAKLNKWHAARAGIMKGIHASYLKQSLLLTFMKL